ncbi:Golgi-associated protein/Nedd4 WW domain-binding protein [Ceraceosorus bombacis]|uniref:Golgi-associated protein/Nedd4 WW domain-binding protein n=1 Tax=Ceraceosorus bombacis TaxID=401625 RepID=A0A0N7LA06_9BASI|nr:Golgi-associated protein/Nedd4 WW domain-binding protein [Ceraceosorus bombacis]
MVRRPTFHSSRSNGSQSRAAELAAAFDDEGESSDLLGSATDGAGDALPPSYDPAQARRASAARERADQVWFDAGDAMGDEADDDLTDDPLGARSSAASSHRTSDRRNRVYGRENAIPSALELGVAPPSPNATESGYDFEAPSYFATAPSSSSDPTAASSSSHVRGNNGARPDTPGPTPITANSNPGGPSSSTYDLSTSSSANAQQQRLPPMDSRMSRVRLALGRFGQFVGMRVPGATYASLPTDDADARSAGASSTRRRVMGGGSGDGVFANLSAKPERRRRTADGGDRGDDDDLVDETLPPTYDVAAADSAPPYWETTIVGGGMHPLAPGGMGWTPGGAHVGEIEDLIVEGLPVGNFFGFAWNLMVSMSFQFVGFLLTYLLHTTHAARCGSRAGLGITLIQYGLFLRTRNLPSSDPLPGHAGSPDGNAPGSSPNEAIVISGGNPWWDPFGDSGSGAPTAAGSLRRAAADMFLRGDAPAPTGNGTMADMLAAGGDMNNANGNAGGGGRDDGLFPVEEGAQWLSYILMVLGWFIVLSSLVSYWRVHRWGRLLVAAARRDRQDTEAAHEPSTGGAGESSGGEEDSTRPVGFIHTLRQALNRRNLRYGPSGGGARATGTGEDWIVFPAAFAGLDGGKEKKLFHGNNQKEAGWDAQERESNLAFLICRSFSIKSSARNSALLIEGEMLGELNDGDDVLITEPVPDPHSAIPDPHLVLPMIWQEMIFSPFTV